jgi:hypothetical protein
MPEATDRNVYILGAGFSAPAGAPVIYTFLERSREFLNNPPRELTPDGLAHFKRVFEFKERIAKAREKISVDLDNIEDLFGVVEMSCRLGSEPIQTRNSMIYVIAKTLELCTEPRQPRGRVGFEMLHERAKRASLDIEDVVVRQSQPNRNEQFTVDLYDFFALLISGALDDPTLRQNRNDVVITFNYDLIIDDALYRVNRPADYGHPLSERSSNAAFPILKLHGSTNWAVCPQCGKPVVSFHKLTRSFSELTAMPCPTCNRNKCQALLIPPSWDKTGHREVMQPVWTAAVNELKRATRICIIGYSMPDSDAFFRYLLTVALADNHHMERLVVVDYSPAAPISFGDENRGRKRNAVGLKWKGLLDATFQERRFVFRETGFSQWLSQHARYDLKRGDDILSTSLYGG